MPVNVSFVERTPSIQHPTPLHAGVAGMIDPVGAGVVEVLAELAVIQNFPRRLFAGSGLGVWNLAARAVETSGGTADIAVQPRGAFHACSVSPVLSQIALGALRSSRCASSACGARAAVCATLLCLISGSRTTLACRRSRGSTSLENLPAPHRLHSDSSGTPVADEYLPAEQFRQVEASLAPTVLLQVPFLHSTHSVFS